MSCPSSFHLISPSFLNNRLHSKIIPIARSYVVQQHRGEGYIPRLKAAKDNGSNVVLLEAFKSKDEARYAVQDLAPRDLLLNMEEKGAGPVIIIKETGKFGFRIMISHLRR